MPTLLIGVFSSAGAGGVARRGGLRGRSGAKPIEFRSDRTPERRDGGPVDRRRLWSMIRKFMSAASFRIDLHVHSLLSGDNLADPEECIVRAIELGLQGLAFTEHCGSYRVVRAARAVSESATWDRIAGPARAVEFSARRGALPRLRGRHGPPLRSRMSPAEELVREVGSRRRRGHPLAPVPRRAACLGDRILALAGDRGGRGAQRVQPSHVQPARHPGGPAAAAALSPAAPMPTGPAMSAPATPCSRSG